MEVPPKPKNRTTVRPSNLTSRYRSKATEISMLMRYLHPVFPAALYTTAKAQNQPKHLSTDEWIKKTAHTECNTVQLLKKKKSENSTHRMQYCSAIKKKKKSCHVTTGMEVQNFMWSEVRQSQTNTAQSHLHVESKKHQIQTNREQNGSSWVREEMGRGESKDTELRLHRMNGSGEI